MAITRLQANSVLSLEANVCAPKPYPRCSNHAGKALVRAMGRDESEPSPRTAAALIQAKKNYLLTPAGEQMLRNQGRTVLADQVLKLRESLIADAKRFHQYSTSLTSTATEWHGDKNLVPELSNPLIVRAYALAVSAHAGVRRKSLEPYVNHPLRTAKHLENLGYNDEVVTVALLHDAVEDSELTLSDLRLHSFNERIVTGVDSVTKRSGESYPEAVARASEHPIGRLVKLSDNLDNSSEEQLKPFPAEKREKQRRKYKPARQTLIVAIYRANRMSEYSDATSQTVVTRSYAWNRTRSE